MNISINFPKFDISGISFNNSPPKTCIPVDLNFISHYTAHQIGNALLLFVNAKLTKYAIMEVCPKKNIKALSAK